ERHLPDVDRLDEDVVEDRLDHVREQRTGRRVARGRDPGRQEAAPVGPRVGEEAPDLACHAGRVAREPREATPPRRRAPGLRGQRGRFERRDRRQRYGLISLCTHALAWLRQTGDYTTGSASASRGPKGARCPQLSLKFT